MIRWGKVSTDSEKQRRDSYLKSWRVQPTYKKLRRTAKFELEYETIALPHLKFVSDEIHFQFIKLWTNFRFFTFWVRLDFESWLRLVFRIEMMTGVGHRLGKLICDWFRQLVNRFQFNFTEVLSLIKMKPPPRLIT